MKPLRQYAGAIALSLALTVTACGPDSEDEAGTASEVQSGEVSEGTGERASRDVLMAQFSEALAAAQATSGPGSPALWTMRDEDTTIYMFGTVHLLRPELEWRTEALESALDSADTIVFEVDMTSEEAQREVMTEFMGRGMYDDGRTLRGVLNDEDEAVISAAFDSAGVPLDAMNAFEPWMASVNLSMMKLLADGYDVSSGVEAILEAEARADGKSFAYLETISQQTDAFDLLPEEEQINMLYETALMLDDSPQMLDLLVSEWADGDVAGIQSLVANPEGVSFTDAAYEALLVKRNKAWVPQIEAMLETPGTVFIAVGAGHLAGPDSVVTMLRDKGYDVVGP